MIPKVIHQIWLGDQTKRPQKLIDTWKKLNPSWEHKLWTEENLPELTCKPQFDSIKELAGKADILRYEILYQFGGFFIDADSECISPLDDFLLDNDSFCCWENEKVRPNLMANGYLAATKNNSLMAGLLQIIKNMDCNYLKKLPPKNAWVTVGPMLLTNVVMYNKYNKIKVYPSWYFIPKHYTGEEYTGNDKVYCKQYFMSTPQSGNSYDN